MPTADSTRDDNLRDLMEHQEAFERREACASTGVSLDESTCLGCVSINPLRGQPTDARGYLWVRQRAYEAGLDGVLFHTVREELAAEMAVQPHALSGPYRPRELAVGESDELTQGYGLALGSVKVRTDDAARCR